MPSRVEQMSPIARRAYHAWVGGAARVHYGRCESCGRVRNEHDRPLLVARQPRRRKFECLACWDGTR